MLKRKDITHNAFLMLPRRVTTKPELHQVLKVRENSFELRTVRTFEEYDISFSWLNDADLPHYRGARPATNEERITGLKARVYATDKEAELRRAHHANDTAIELLENFGKVAEMA